MTSLDDNDRELQHNQCMVPSRDSLGKIAWAKLDFLSQGKISDILIWCARNVTTQLVNTKITPQNKGSTQIPH